jgi:hypothetical protein
MMDGDLMGKDEEFRFGFVKLETSISHPRGTDNYITCPLSRPISVRARTLVVGNMSF